MVGERLLQKPSSCLHFCSFTWCILTFRLLVTYCSGTIQFLKEVLIQTYMGMILSTEPYMKNRVLPKFHDTDTVGYIYG